MDKKQQEQMLEKLDPIVEGVMKQWNVEGLALGIVDQGEVLLEKGYGWRSLEEKKEMTAQTVLPIGSATKSFTALVLAMLADAGKVEPDLPVKTYIPWLERNRCCLDDRGHFCGYSCPV